MAQSYEPLYSAVSGAAPTVLVAYVLEWRHFRQHSRYLEARAVKPMALFTIAATGLAALLSVYGLASTDAQTSKLMAYFVALFMVLGTALFLIQLLFDAAAVRPQRQTPP